jgi:hypothetical protein
MNETLAGDAEGIMKALLVERLLVIGVVFAGLIVLVLVVGFVLRRPRR